jgi:hypothetical protein
MPSIHARTLLALALGAVTSSLACGDLVDAANPLPEKQARCDLRPERAQCTDIRKFQGPSLVAFQGVCDSLESGSPNTTGYQADVTCPTTGMLGGCQTKSSDGSLQTNWYYTGTEYPDQATARAECESGEAWVNPS